MVECDDGMNNINTSPLSFATISLPNVHQRPFYLPVLISETFWVFLRRKVSSEDFPQLSFRTIKYLLPVLSETTKAPLLWYHPRHFPMRPRHGEPRSSVSVPTRGKLDVFLVGARLVWIPYRTTFPTSSLNLFETD